MLVLKCLHQSSCSRVFRVFLCFLFLDGSETGGFRRCCRTQRTTTLEFLQVLKLDFMLFEVVIQFQHLSSFPVEEFGEEDESHP